MVFLNILYPDTAVLSVDASHAKSICEFDAAVAVRFCGTLGASVSGSASVVALAGLDCALSLPAAS